MPETAAPRIIKQSRATAPQREFWASTARYRCISGGVGSGKSYAGVVEAIRQPKGTTGMVLAPTYPMLRDSTLQAFLGVVQRAGILVSFNSGTMTAKLKGDRTVLFRTADKPDRLRGPNLSWFWIDEAAMVSPQTWSIMIGRLRVHPGVAWITTTPRGKNWVYKTFVEGGADYKLVKAPTRTNTFLPGHFVDSLLANYDTHFAQQEVDGEFLDDATGKLIPDSWLERMVKCEPSKWRAADLAVSVDLAAGHGGDKTVIMLGHRHGIVKVVSSTGVGPVEAARLVADLVGEYGVSHDRVVYDEGGVLLAEEFERHLHTYGIRRATAYNGSWSGGDEHANMRSWAYFQLRSWLTPDMPTEVRDVPRDEWDPGPDRRAVKYQAPFTVPRGPIPDWWPALKEELAALRHEMRGKLHALESKDKLKAAIKRSPDLSDALAQLVWKLS